MKIKNTLLAACLALPCFAQVAEIAPAEKELLKDLKHPVHPCLWEVTGKDLKKPSYLFGTCHVSDPRITNLHPKAKKAFEKSDTVYGEIDIKPEDAGKIAMLMVRKDGKTVTKHLGEKRAAKVNKALKAVNPALSLQAGLDNLKTWAVGLTLATLEEQMKGGKALDQHLLDDARKAGKTTASLESIESQMGCFNSIKPSHELLMIDSTLEYLDQADGKNPLDEIKETYLLKTPKEIGDYVKKSMTYTPNGREQTEEEKELTQWFIAEFLDKRNIKMAEKIDDFLEKKSAQSHFFAVGAAHYTGNTAIQDLLKKKGYQITPLFKK